MTIAARKREEFDVVASIIVCTSDYGLSPLFYMLSARWITRMLKIFDDRPPEKGRLTLKDPLASLHK
uniref:Uncharacterized protein n=1 Tax=Romanomermis culicivorax TaxID=13658 RepID=A0A915HJT7_ROMCU